MFQLPHFGYAARRIYADGDGKRGDHMYNYKHQLELRCRIKSTGVQILICDVLAESQVRRQVSAPSVICMAEVAVVVTICSAGPGAHLGDDNVSGVSYNAVMCNCCEREDKSTSTWTAQIRTYRCHDGPLARGPLGALCVVGSLSTLQARSTLLSCGRMRISRHRLPQARKCPRMCRISSPTAQTAAQDCA